MIEGGELDATFELSSLRSFVRGSAPSAFSPFPVLLCAMDRFPSELRQAVRDCRDRGLVTAAKWSVVRHNQVNCPS